MKSLKDIEISRKQIFSKEIMDFIINEGFEYKTNDSYCNPMYIYLFHHQVSSNIYRDNCYYKHVGIYSNLSINCYIFDNGIGVDINTIYGDNYSKEFFSIDNRMSFEGQWNEMFKYIQPYIKSN